VPGILSHFFKLKSFIILVAANAEQRTTTILPVFRFIPPYKYSKTITVRDKNNNIPNIYFKFSTNLLSWYEEDQFLPAFI